MVVCIYLLINYLMFLKMKTTNFFLSMLAIAGMLAAVSCSQKEQLGEPAADEFVNATFSLGASDAIGTRAANEIGMGLNADKVACAVYDADGVELTDLYAVVDVDMTSTPRTATYSVRLVKGQAYRVAFFAYNSAADAYDVSDLTQIQVKPGQSSNLDARDAFTNYIDVPSDMTMTDISETVVLTRPFAQLNLGISDQELQAAQQAGIVVAQTQITVTDVYSVFSAYDNAVAAGAVAGETAFSWNDIPTEKLLADVDNDGTQEEYNYLAFNYLLVGNTNAGEKALTNVEFQWQTADGSKTNDPVSIFLNIPVQRNYRTNILGNLLTSPADFTLTIDADFETPDNNVVNPPLTYAMVHTAQELVDAFAQADVIRLYDNVDMSGVTWTPAGTQTEPFVGEIDGRGYTISNVNVDATDYAAFIAYAGDNVKISNLTLENVNIQSTKYAAGVVCVAGDNVTIENVTVSGTVNADYTYTSSGQTYAGGYAAGIVHDADGITIKNCVNNATITSNARGAGIASWISNATVENVVNNGDVTGGYGASGIFNRFSGTISKAVNYGDVLASGDQLPQWNYEPAGGVVCVQLGASTYEYCYNYGSVTTVKDDPNASAAGILGQTPGSTATFNYCANFGDITAEACYAAGIGYGMYGGMMKANYCFNAGTVTGADGAGGIAPKPQFSGDSNATFCLNSGVVTSSAGTAYQVASKNVTSYYYNGNGDLLNVTGNTAVTADEALAVLNGGADIGFFIVSSGKITVTE